MKILYVSFLIVLIDQATKLLVRGFKIPWLGIKVDGMRIGETKPLIGDFVRITYTENPGMAFGINLGNKFYLTFLAILAVIVVFAYLYKVRNDHFLIRLSLGMIIGGAVGNLIDRIFYGVIFNYGKIFHGRVVDFIDVDFFDMNIFGYHIDRWPIFNIADASVTIGVLIFLFTRQKKELSDKETNPELGLKNAESRE